MTVTHDQEDKKFIEETARIQNEGLRTFFTQTTSEDYKPDCSEAYDKEAHSFHICPENKSEKGYKESKDKLTYELDWNFIQSIAERMATNKGKYEPYNWKKPIDIESLKQSLFRHVIEVMKGDYEDDDRDLGHLEAIALNAMFIFYNLKNN